LDEKIKIKNKNMSSNKNIKTILRKSNPKPQKREKIKISNPIDFRSFVPLVIVLLLVIVIGCKLFFKKDNVPSNESIIKLGIEEIKRGNLDAAGKKFEEILKKDANNKDAIYNLALIKYINNDYDNAISDFENMIKKNPDDAEYYNILGNILRDKKEYDQALLRYREAIKADPNFVQAYINMSDLMSVMGNKEGARKIIEEGLLKNPDNEKLLKFKEIYAEKK